MDFAASGNQRFLHFCAGSLRDKELHLFPNPCGTVREPRGWKLWLLFHETAAGSTGAWVGAGPEGARGSGVGQARCQVAGEGPPNEGRAVRTRPRGAGASTSFLPPQPHSLALGSSAFPNHQRPPSPFFPPRPAPASAAHLRPLLRPRPRPRPPLVGPRAWVPSPSWRRPLSQ